MQHNVTHLDELTALHKQFSSRPKPPTKVRTGVFKPIKRPKGSNRKFFDFHAEAMFKMRYVDNSSYQKIGRQLNIHPMNVLRVLQRYEKHGMNLVDKRKFNGRARLTQKITPVLAEWLISEAAMQKWSGLCLEQRCMILKRDHNVTISPNGLRLFYQRHRCRYLVVSYQYWQAMQKPKSEKQAYALRIAKIMREGALLVYFDEASFNLWLRNRRTWTSVDRPCKMVLNKSRCKGMTVFGAISDQMKHPMFTIEKSTNEKAFIEFLGKLRRRIGMRSRRIHLVLDNARAHVTINSKTCAANENIDLMFMPAYSPELNSIESLWSVIKRDWKRRIISNLDHDIKDEEAEVFLRQSLDSITGAVAKKAARFNNRHYLEGLIGDLVKDRQPFFEPDPVADPDDRHSET